MNRIDELAERAKAGGPYAPGFIDQMAALALGPLAPPAPGRVSVVLFKAGGKYYTEEPWRIPDGAIGPFDMGRSPDFRRIGRGGHVLIPEQEPWGYPHLFVGPPIVEEMTTPDIRDMLHRLTTELAGRAVR